MITTSLLIVLYVCLIFAMRFFATEMNLMDHPGGRKFHAFATPPLGGLAIYMTVIAALTIYSEWDSDVGSIVFWGGAIVLIGLFDDIKALPWPVKLFVQLAAASGVTLTTGIKVAYIGEYPIIGPIELGPLSAIFTIVAVVGLTNAFNLIDGIDGLCGGLLLLPVSCLLLIEFFNSGYLDYFLLILIALLFLFLVFNLTRSQKYKIFMGDSGSAGIGFIVSFLAILKINNEASPVGPMFALWVFLIPIVDTIHVIAKRAMEKRSIFQAGLDHLHHRLMEVGCSPAKTLWLLLIAASFGIVMGFVLDDLSHVFSLFLFLVTALFLPGIIIRIGSSRYNKRLKNM